jgi:3-dehydroquinate synthase
MAAPTRISLIGFSGTGKSAVVKLLAERLGWRAIDTDELIAKGAGKTIAQIFQDQGEGAFRALECQTLLDLEGEKRIAVAVGGGATTFDASRQSIVESGIVVCLEATPETIVTRLTADADEERPLLESGDQLARVRKLKAQRAALYALADFTVHTDGLSAKDVAGEIMRLYQERGDLVFDRPGRVAALTEAPSLPPLVDAPGAAIIVRTASAEYPAFVEWNALEGAGERVKRATNARRAFLISDDNVLKLHGETVVASLREAGIETETYMLPPGDASKSLASTGRIYDWLASHRAERRDAVFALGGGMVGDLAGFVAGTYVRGMPFVQAPTSLLAMVDASIGGKTAVNHGEAKNLVGLFYQPRAVIADVASLQTLPRRELVEGLGEVIKHAFILSPELLEILESRLDDLLALQPELTTDVVRRNVAIKGAVVSEDERETGGRREVLNFGHTLGHAFEAAGNYQDLLHGEAVSVGMVAAAEIGVRMKVTPPGVAGRLRALLERAGLPLKPPPAIDRARVEAALKLDKKVVAGAQRWVLLEDVGKTTVRNDVPPETVAAVLDELLATS